MRNCAQIIIIVCIVAIASCAKAPRIDTSSNENLQESLEKVKAALPDEKKAAFDNAMNTITVNMILDSPSSLLAAGIARDPKVSEAIMMEVMKDLDGKTGEEVIAYAANLNKEGGEK